MALYFDWKCGENEILCDAKNEMAKDVVNNIILVNGDWNYPGTKEQFLSAASNIHVTFNQ